MLKRYELKLDDSWVQNVAFWPFDLLTHELAERKVGKGDRAARPLLHRDAWS